MNVTIIERNVQRLECDCAYLCINPSEVFIVFYSNSKEHLIISPDSDRVGSEVYISTEKLSFLLKDTVIHEIVVFWGNLLEEINRALNENCD